MTKDKTVMVRDSEALKILQRIRRKSEELAAVRVEMGKAQEVERNEVLRTLYATHALMIEKMVEEQNAFMGVEFKQLTKALDMIGEDPYKWRIDMQYLENHGVAFLTFDENLRSPFDKLATSDTGDQPTIQ